MSNLAKKILHQQMLNHQTLHRYEHF